MQTRGSTKNGMKGFFDPVIGGALLLIYGAVALLAVNGQRQEDHQAAASAAQQVTSVDTVADHARDRQAEHR